MSVNSISAVAALVFTQTTSGLVSTEEPQRTILSNIENPMATATVFEEGGSFQIAQMDGDDAARLFICALSENCREDLKDQILGGNSRGRSTLVQRKDRGDDLRPEEIINEPGFRGAELYTTVKDRRGRDIDVWNISFGRAGDLCVGINEDRNPLAETSSVLGNVSCAELDGNRDTRRQPRVDRSVPDVRGGARSVFADGRISPHEHAGVLKTYPNQAANGQYYWDVQVLGYGGVCVTDTNSASPNSDTKRIAQHADGGAPRPCNGW